MSRRRRIYEGKAKVLYEGPEPGTLIQHFKDDATAFNAKKHAVIEGKGVLNNRISEYLFEHGWKRSACQRTSLKRSTCANSWCAKLKSFRLKLWCATWRQDLWRPNSALKKACSYRALDHRVLL